MEPGYLLDTKVISEWARHPNGAITDKVAEVGADAVCTSVIVSSELLFVVRSSPSESLRKQLSWLLSDIELLPFETPADSHYADIRTYLRSREIRMRPYDMLVAAHARCLELTLVTANEPDFEYIPELNVENWLAEEESGVGPR